MSETEGTTPAPESATPCSTGWCSRHEDGEGGWCSSRLIRVGDVHLEISNGTDNGELALYGLRDLPEAVDLATARRVVLALTELLLEVGR